MTHLCSVKVTHTKNTICPLAREEASDIIHAEGVRFAVPSSAPQARKVLSLRKDIRAPMKTAIGPCAGEAGPHVSCRWQKRRYPAAKRRSPGRGAGSLLVSKVWSFLARAEVSNDLCPIQCWTVRTSKPNRNILVQ